MKIEKKPELSEFEIEVRAANLEGYLNEETKIKIKEKPLLFYPLDRASIKVSGSGIPPHRVKLNIINGARKEYVPKEEPKEVELLIATINIVREFLNEEALKEIEEGRGIEFIGDVSIVPELERFTARIKVKPFPEESIPKKID